MDARLRVQGRAKADSRAKPRTLGGASVPARKQDKPAAMVEKFHLTGIFFMLTYLYMINIC